MKSAHSLTVTFVGGGGSGAAGVAVLSSVVTGLTLTSGGSGYTTAPTVTLVGGGMGNTVCTNGVILSNCSSSVRYKKNIVSLGAGLNVVSRLRPITFKWKEGGQSDLGLVAEEVNDVEPLLVTRNARGEIEGVKYDRLSAVFINAFKEQQAQIEQQRSQIELLRMANATLNSRLQAIEKRLRSRGGSSRRRR